MPDMTPSTGSAPENRERPDDRRSATPVGETPPAPETALPGETDRAPREATEERARAATASGAPLTTAPGATGTTRSTAAPGSPGSTGSTDAPGAVGIGGSSRAAAGTAAVEPKSLRPEPGATANEAGGTGVADGTGTGRTGTGGTGTGRTGTGGKAVEAGERAATAGHHDTRGASSLLPDEECDRIATRLRHAVVGFVDGPRDAVVEADEVLEELAGRLTEAVARRRSTLRGSWQQEGGGKTHGGKDRGPTAATAVDTEQLRLALRDYRELTERLLHL
ncbi:hypothetical protein QFZ56_002454 [Streptomyces achromogenes]|uniref:Uncharacterized protein n=1 Tax=Streptomyces achromogenes TaxID=67255 RepID=A0ABU0PZC5_STRAH|nr:hypothetical protein [Streptomyces achromogenes]MDQ0683491.1 hypothetical protein [Streptomyces achromogenes]